MSSHPTVSQAKGIWKILIEVVIGTTVLTVFTAALMAWRTDRQSQIQLESGIINETDRGREGEGEAQGEGGNGDEEGLEIVTATALRNGGSGSIELQDIHGESSNNTGESSISGG